MSADGTLYIGGHYTENVYMGEAMWNGVDWHGKSCVVAKRRASVSAIACPACGTMNPSDATECGAGRWNGCGGALRGTDKII